MALVDQALMAVHLLFAAVWTGSVVFVTWAVLPLARDGEVSPGPLRSVVARLRTLSRLAAVVLLLTGGHVASTIYTADSLFGSTRGHAVLGMVALWLALVALVEVGSGRLDDGLSVDKLREPARNATAVYRAAAVVSLLLLLDAGWLAGG